MTALDLPDLLEPVSAESPSGADAAYDADCIALFTLAQGKPERQEGESVRPAEDPNWRDVLDAATTILRRSKHLRVAVLATLASLQVRGLPGLAEGLSLVRAYLERYWDSLFPRLDPSDGNDPLERANILAALSPPGLADRHNLRRRLREAPLCASQQWGRFALRDIAASVAGASADGEPAPDAAIIDAAFDATPLDDLRAASSGLADSIEHLGAIAGAFEAKAPGSAPDFSALRKDLLEAQSHIQRALSRRAGEVAAEGLPIDRIQVKRPSAGAGGPIRSTQDVLQAIDEICQYYERSEPSSPVPLLLRRARRLVSANFLDIIGDLSPDAIGHIRTITGVKDPQND